MIQSFKILGSDLTEDEVTVFGELCYSSRCDCISHPFLCVCVSLTGDLAFVLSCRQGLCVCVSLTGDLTPVWSCRQGLCVCVPAWDYSNFLYFTGKMRTAFTRKKREKENAPHYKETVS